jgi:hypothetical protein
VGLSEHVIQTAVQIGESRGQAKQNNGTGETYPLLKTRPQNPEYAVNEPHPVVWVTQNQLAEAFDGFEDLGRAMYKKLHVYAGAEHPHAAQQPAALDL